MRVIDRLIRRHWEEHLDKICQEAGRLIMTHFRGSTIEYREKADQSPVTAADLQAHQYLLGELNRLSADIPIISEESFTSDHVETRALVENKAAYWLIDPLDGTREFIAGRHEFSVNIALMEGGRPVAGWVYMPVHAVLYKGIAGLGAYKMGHDADKTVLCTRPCDAKSPTVLVSRSHQFGEADLIRRQLPQAKIEAIGSSYKYLLIAEGSADLAARRTPTHYWDTAAADVILSEAGGNLIGWDGRPLEYTRADMTNPPFLAIADRKLDWRKKFGFLLGLE